MSVIFCIFYISVVAVVEGLVRVGTMVVLWWRAGGGFWLKGELLEVNLELDSQILRRKLKYGLTNSNRVWAKV